jgi:hypothetical protein
MEVVARGAERVLYPGAALLRFRHSSSETTVEVEPFTAIEEYAR